MTRILIVEDEPEHRPRTRRGPAARGVRVEVAATATRPCERGEHGAFDLILLDVMLPGKDGFDVCRELRRAGMRHADRGADGARAGGREGARARVGRRRLRHQALQPRELRARIKAHLRRSAETGAGESIRFGDAELDFGRCELRRGGQMVDLSALEFKLLSAFVKRSGRLLSRAQLLDEVWVGYPRHRPGGRQPGDESPEEDRAGPRASALSDRAARPGLPIRRRRRDRPVTVRRLVLDTRFVVCSQGGSRT